MKSCTDQQKKMIDFLVSVKKQEGPQNTITIPLPITIGGESDGPKYDTQPIRVFLPRITHFHDVRLNKAQYIVIGDFIVPEGEKLSRFFESNPITESIKNFRGFFYIIEITRDSIRIFSSLFNVLPVFYFQNNNSIMISSKAHIISDHLNESLTLNRRFILEQKLFNYAFLNETIYKEIKTLPCNSHIELNNFKLIVHRHLDLGDYFVSQPVSWRKSISGMVDLFLDRVAYYFPDHPFYISMTGGFDGRTLVACARKYGKTFKTYSFGSDDNWDLTIPLEQSPALGLDFTPIYLDEEYVREGFLEGGKELMKLTDGNSNFLQVHFLYAAKLLSGKSPYVINGMFGSEVFRAMHASGQVTSRAMVDVFKYDDEKEWIEKIKTSATLKYLNIDKFSREMESLIEDLILYKRNLEKGITRNQIFYKYVFEEAARKFFGNQILSQFPYIKVRSPYLDLKFMKEIFQTELSGANNTFFTNNPLKRYKGQLFYASVIEKCDKPLLYQKTDKHYRPIDLISPMGKMKVMCGYLKKKSKMKFSPPILDNLKIVSGILANLEFFKSIQINDDLFNKKIIREKFKNDLWLKDRDKFIETLSTNYYISQIFN
jgi:hypothetical protein